jgi:hypothetical protein
MKKIDICFRSLCFGLALVVLLAGCSPGAAVPAASTPVPSPTAEDGYIQAAERFFAWYIADANQRLSVPPNQRAYRTSQSLTPAMIEKADLLFAAPPEVWNSDPLLCAQMVPPELHAIHSFPNGTRPLLIMSIPHPTYYFVVDMARSEAGWQIDDIHCPFTPEGKISAFFIWALGLRLDGFALVEQIVIRDAGFLADSYRDELAQRLVGEEDLQADPVFASLGQAESFEHQPCAQEGCTQVNLVYPGEVVRALEVLWQQNERSYEYEITGLVWAGQSHREVTPAPTPTSPPVVEREKSSARLAAEQFYGEHLAQYLAGRNPLVEGAYQSSPYIFGGWAYEVQLLAAEGPGDPFLCSADIPETFSVQASVIEDGAAHLLARTEPNGQFFTLEMAAGEEWQIMRVICPDSAEGAAWAFYTWYIGYSIGEQVLGQSPELLRSPLADGAYRSSPFLTAAAAGRAAEVRLEANADPFLDAQVFPQGYWIAPGETPDQAVVRLQFGPMSARYLHLRVEQGPGQWAISEITPQHIPVFDPEAGREVDVSDWQTFTDRANGFSFRYPRGLMVKDQRLSPGMSWEELKRLVVFLPSRNPNQAVPTLILEVIQTPDEDALNRMHVTESFQRASLNGFELRVEREPGTVRYTFHNPARPDFWLVLIDNTSEAPGQDSQAAGLESGIMPLLHSLRIEP